MKRLLSLVGCIAVLSLIPLTSAWAVWEGNAGIGAASEFPGSGLYARSDMFPKNTIVEIKNLETEKTVRAVITGSSGVPGLVAVLSPDTAAALNIKAGSVTRVRISVPSVTERPAAGTIVDSSKTANADPDTNPAAAAKPKDSEIPLETIAESPKDPLVALAPEPAAAPAAIAPASAAPAATAVPSAATAPAAVATESAPEPAAAIAPVAAPAATTAPVAETPATEAATPAATAVAPAAVVASSEQAPSSPSSETVEPAKSAVPENSEPVSEPELAVAPAESVPPENKPVADSEIPDARESEVALVPAEPMPPEAPPVAKEDVPVVAEVAPSVTPEAPAQAAIETVPEIAAAPAHAVPAPVATAAPTKNASSIPVTSALVKGGYYIQIGTYSDSANVQKIIDTFGKKYPVTVEKKTGTSGDALKVSIGPVKKDEYGAVLERFKQLGFKDAFVKKGQ